MTTEQLRRFSWHWHARKLEQLQGRNRNLARKLEQLQAETEIWLVSLEQLQAATEIWLQTQIKKRLCRKN